MKIIDEFLSESFPQNPNDAVLSNHFYPKGLTESEIYNYYMKVKPLLLGWLANRKSAFFLMINDEIVVKRNLDGKPIKLTNANYSKLITGRTLQILVENPEPSKYFVIDVDAGVGVNRKDLLKASDVAKEIMAKSSVTVENWERLYTSPRGIHVIGYMNRGVRVKEIIKILTTELREGQSDYLVNVKGRHPGTINFDLSPNYKRGIHIARYSLTKEGLICDDIDAPSNKAGKKI